MVVTDLSFSEVMVNPAFQQMFSAFCVFFVIKVVAFLPLSVKCLTTEGEKCFFITPLPLSSLLEKFFAPVLLALFISVLRFFIQKNGSLVLKHPFHSRNEK